MLYIFDIDGTLIAGYLDTRTCDSCKGHGRKRTPMSHTEIRKPVYVPCGVCKGKGQIFGQHLPYDEVRPLPGRKEKLHELARQGHKIALATNQGGIALGYQTTTEVQMKLGRVCAEFNFFYGAAFSVHYAQGHKDAKNELFRTPDLLHRRKPNPGMIEDAMEAHAADGASHAVPSATFVGDLATDRDAAEAAGIPFVWAEDFFADPKRGDGDAADAR